MSFTLAYKNELLRTIDAIDLAVVDEAIAWLAEARAAGRTIFIAGNGGSAATASHFVCDMVKGASYQRRERFRVLCLNDNLPTLTAYSNDVGYDTVFAEQLKNFAQPGDVYIAISGSGNSPNVVKAMETAEEMGCRTIAMTGRDGGALAKLAQLHLHVSVPHMGRIEDAHMIICHMIGYYFMEETNSTE
jgi:D-sedoheptulose 7-phosphate isomerase